MIRSTAQLAYRLSHGEIRSHARFSLDRERALKKACDDRKFWLGDVWSVPATLPAQAALRVLNGSMRGDPLRAHQHLAGIGDTAAKKAVAAVVLGALRLTNRGL